MKKRGLTSQEFVIILAIIIAIIFIFLGFRNLMCSLVEVPIIC